MSRRTAPVLSRLRAWVLVAGAVGLACTACTSGKGSAAADTSTISAPVASATSATSATSTTSGPASSSSVTATSSGAATPSASTPASADPPPNPASVHANELGLVPVMMYHKLNAHPTSDYDRRPSDFVADLTYLEKNHFYPVTAADYVSGKIDIPAGKHPVVLTFDDGTTVQFALGADGKPKPGTALALLQTFAASHPDFPAVATFFVNAAPFGSKAGEDVLKYLTSHGDEVGDHTVHHYDLSTKSAAVAQAEIAQNLQMIETADPGYKVTTFALPFGASPKPKALRVSGSSGGVSYTFAGVFAVGANPAHSPYNSEFDPGYIPRIRAENQADAKPADRPYISSHWLPLIVSEPAELYTSDGDPQHVSYPRTTTIQVAAKWKSEAQPY